MKNHIDLKTLDNLAAEIETVLGRRSSKEQLFEDLYRFVRSYGLRLDEAKRAVMVLHGVPPGLTGPADRRYTWQQELDAYDAT